MNEGPITDEYGNTMDVNGKVVGVWCLPGAKRGTLSIVPNGTAILDRERINHLIRALSVALQRMPDANRQDVARHAEGENA